MISIFVEIDGNLYFNRMIFKAVVLVVSFLFVYDSFSQEPGDVDVSFASNGELIISNGGTSELNESNNFGFQSDGSIVVATTTWNLFNEFTGKLYVRSFNSDGTFNSNFGNMGVMPVDTSNVGFYTLGEVLVLPNAKILAYGATLIHNLFKLNLNGSVDSTFGMNGMINCEGNNIKLSPSEKITTSWRHQLFQFNLDGSVNTNFGVDGILTLTSNFIRISDYEFYNSDALLVVGFDTTDVKHKLFKIDFSGNVDTSFGNNGFLESMN